MTRRKSAAAISPRCTWLTNRSLSGFFGSFGSNRISAKNSAAMSSAIEKQLVGCPLPASDVARAESADSVSAANGGSLGKGTKGRFVAPFEAAAAALKTGEISQPVLTQFGYHLIKLDARKGDTATISHILLRIQQSDSAAAKTDRRADSLARMAASADQPAKFDSAARALQIPIIRSPVIEGNTLTVNGQYIPSVGPWAFQGARPGETSELFDAEDGYYLARLDSLTPGGTLSLDQAKNDIVTYLRRQKKIDLLLPQARNFAKVAAASTTRATSVRSPRAPGSTVAGAASRLTRAARRLGSRLLGTSAWTPPADFSITSTSSPAGTSSTSARWPLSTTPARPVAGLIAARGRFYYHAWPEVYLGDWVQPMVVCWGLLICW